MSYEKTAAQDWFVKVNSDGTKSASFTNKGQIGKQMWAEMLASGETASEYVAPIPEPLIWDEQRRIAYIEDDCTLERFTELTLEGNTAEIASLKERHSAVRLRIPKPE